MKIYFITTNYNKFEEARRILGNKINLKILPLKTVEIQSENVEEVVNFKLNYWKSKLKNKNFIVEDSGLYITALKGFPGSLTSWIIKYIGNNGILKLMKNIKNREAVAKCALGLCFNKTTKIFVGQIKGKISEKEKGKYGFGFDPIFIPNGYNKTFGEIGIEIKNKISHRAKAFKKLLNFLMKINLNNI